MTKTNYKKKYEAEKSAYKQMSLAHTHSMMRERESNMAFDELVSRVDSSKIREALYELKECKLEGDNK